MDTGFVTEPLTARCREVAARQQHACVGISLFNGYFNASSARVAEPVSGPPLSPEPPRLRPTGRTRARPREADR
ncbi:tRNA-dependent cyclodipeptide synthase [Streptomyces sp. NPDC001536]|uniref:tRNA-dependent cyclodipeptide synthase n=1 Tax=Streptomyces sp. NPDC001536 TaxID=3364583 RepID=UPI0036779284